MNEHKSFSDSIYEEQSHLAERELFWFDALIEADRILTSVTKRLNRRTT
jgi:hypothetical protein